MREPVRVLVVDALKSDIPSNHHVNGFIVQKMLALVCAKGLEKGETLGKALTCLPISTLVLEMVTCVCHSALAVRATKSHARFHCDFTHRTIENRAMEVFACMILGRVHMVALDDATSARFQCLTGLMIVSSHGVSNNSSALAHLEEVEREEAGRQ